MTDEERLIAAVTKGWVDWRTYEGMAGLVSSIRAAGVTLTPPPAPEPTYTIRLTEIQRNQVANGLHERYHNDPEWMTEKVRELFERICDATPDEDTDGPDGR